MTVGAASGDVAVVVVNWNTRRLLRECLGLLRDDEVRANNVWVVDNGSADGSADMVYAEFPAANLVRNQTNVGFAAANNQVLRSLGTRYALLLNTDARVPAGGIARLAADLESMPAVAIVGPMYVWPDGSFQASYADFPGLASEVLQALGLARRLVRPGFPSHGPGADAGLRRVDWVFGACMMVRMSAVRDVGLLDEGFFFYGEEVDWCYRFRGCGWGVWYDPSVVVTHLVGQSAQKDDVARRWHLYRARLRFFAKHKSRAQSRVLKVALVVSLAAHLCRTGIASRPRTGSGDWRRLAGLVLRLAHEPSRAW